MAFNTSKALKSRVVLLSGEEEVLRRRALQELFDAAGIQADDFDLETYDAGSSTPTEWMASCGTTPFLSERRVSLVRHVLRFLPDRAKPEEFKSLPAHALLILIADEEAGDDAKQVKFESIRKGWEKLIVGAGGVVEEFKFDSKQVRNTLKADLAKVDRKMSEAALNLLVEMCGSSYSRCLDEIEKLLLYTEGAPSIQEADVRSLVVASRDWNVFTLSDSIISGNVVDSMKQLQIMVGSQNKAEDAAMRNIFPTLSRNLRLLWQARIFIDARCSLDNPTPEVLARLPKKPNIVAERDWMKNKIMNSARTITLPQLAQAINVLSLSDSRMKGLETSYSAMDTLERMALEMIEIFKKR